jgi:hypothetical protein
LTVKGYGAQKTQCLWLTNVKTFETGMQYTYSLDTLHFMPAHLTKGTKNTNEMIL